MIDAYPPDIKAFVLSKIASGEFQSADEFAVQAAKVYRDLEQRGQNLKQSVTDAIADLDAGNYIELKNEDELRQFAEDIKRRGRERLLNASPNV